MTIDVSPPTCLPDAAPTVSRVGPTDVAADLARAGRDLQAGRLQEALDRVRAVLADFPDQPDATRMVGQLAIYLGEPAAALPALQRSVALAPGAESRIWLSLCLEQLGHADDALRELDAAIECMPPTAGAQFAIGLMLEKLARPAQALRFFTACIALDACHAEAHYHQARVLQEAGRHEAAVDAYQTALRCCDTKAEYYTDLCAALSDLGRFDEALVVGEMAVRLDPETAEGHNNLGHTLLNLNRSADAVRAYDRAIAARPGYVKARFGRALARLKGGDFEPGWQDYELRWRDCQAPRRDLAGLAWQGEAIDGKTILLHAEQGFGDTLQFVRFAPLVASRGARVIVEVPRPLVRLVRRVDGIAEVVACGDPLPAMDLHCPMLSLPLAFGLRLDTIPASPYLREAGDRPPRHCVAGAAPDGDLVVGLVWAGDPRKAELRSNLVDRRRSTTLAAFAPLWDIAGVRFVSFQLGEARGEIARCGRPMLDAMDGVGDFADTAARLSGVDLLIGVDTAMVHLAGGLGMPVWMLSRFDGCWRWLEGRDTTPWYPTMRIFRQPSAGDWSGMMTEVAAALEGACVARGRRRTATGSVVL